LIGNNGEVLDNPPRMYSAWHLNLNYSSVDISARPEVIDRCYWPLLALAESTGCPQGIEISGSTLQTIQELDPSWIAKFIDLENLGLVEVLASGFEQIVGPLAPANVNHANISLGQKVLSDILGISPSIFFVNEQCASNGVMSLVQDLGFKGAIMEWENAWIANQSWPRKVGFAPQRFRTNEGIAIIWNHSRFFQGLQRYVHEELHLHSLIKMYEECRDVGNAALCFYGGDAETFDFRAGRFSTEAKQVEGEWKRVEDVIRLTIDTGAIWTLPRDLLSGDLGMGVNPFSFENPILTKKQPKYNVVRWAVSGRNNYELNNYSHMLAKQRETELRESTGTQSIEALELWASDLRTHITEKRWSNLTEQHPGVGVTSPTRVSRLGFAEIEKPELRSSEISMENERLQLGLDLRKGMTVSAAVCKCKSGAPLLGRLPFGALQGPLHSPDWYSGNFVHTPPGKPQDSDISFLPKSARFSRDKLSLETRFSTTNFELLKTISIDSEHAAYTTTFEFEWKHEPFGSLRAGFMTLIPDSWDWESTHFGSHDGGFDETIWKVSDAAFDMGGPVSPFVSARGLAGITEGQFWVEDSSHRVEVELNESSRGAGLMLAGKSASSTLFRSFFSIQEYDDTFQPGRRRTVVLSYETRVKCASL